MRQLTALFATILCTSCCLLSGCLESSFQLSDASRLPIWIKLPPTIKRQEISLTLNYYSNPFGPNARFILKNQRGETLQAFSGSDEPIGDASSEMKYPLYRLITVNGVSEIVEHRRMEPIFYISDDQGVKSKVPK